MSFEQLNRIFRPQRLALVGASDQPDSVGAELTRQALAAGGIELHLVNRRRAEIYGRAALEDVAGLPDDLDLAVVMTPWSGVPGIVATLAAKRCAGVLVLSVAQPPGGLLWDSSRLLLGRLQRQLRRSPIRLLGPASQGLLLPQQGLNLSLCAKLPPAGHIGFVAGSAAVTDFFADWAASQGVGCSLALGLGDELDVDAPLCLEYFARDPQTRAVLLYLDRMVEPRRWLSAARALTARKPLVVLVDPAFASAGAAATPEPLALLGRALERAGALVVHDLEELCAAANVDLPAWPHAGSRFAVLGNTPALAALATRAIERSGGGLARLDRATERSLKPLLPRIAPANPVDLKRDADGVRYAAALDALRRDPGVDVVLCLHHSNAFAAGAQVAAALTPSGDGAPPLLASFVGGTPRQVRAELGRRGIAAFATPESAVAAYALNRRYFQLRHALRSTPPALLEAPPDAARLAPARALDLGREARIGVLLQCLQIDLAVQPEAAATSPALGLRSDPRLGLLAWASADRRETFELLPLDRARAAQLLAVLDPLLDEELLAQLRRAVLLLAQAAPLLPELRAIELYGIRRGAEGELQAAVRLDWNLDAAGLEARPARDFAFAPPPGGGEWVTLREGPPLLLRPIRAEDQPRLAAGFTRLTPEEVRMRFMFPLKQLTHELGARLTQLDYDREVALVLSGPEPPGQAELFGVVRASFEVLEQSAEFAIVIPRALSGQGLGTLLLQRIVEHCRARGIRRIHGDVLAENAAMLALARKLGFDEQSEAEQHGVVRVVRQLD